MGKIIFASLRRRNQLTSFLIFLSLFALLLLSFIRNPWYQIPVNWYFVPVIGLVGAFLLPAFFGRHYCGQYCPTGFLSDSMDTRSKAGSILKSRHLRKVMVVLFIGIFAVSFSTWDMWLPASMTGTYWQAAISKLWVLWLVCPFLIAMPLIIGLGLTKGGRTWCNYICPWAEIGVKFGRRALKVTDDCTECGQCLKVCPQPEVIAPVIGKGGEVDANCLTCLRCADVCSGKAIEYIRK